MDTYILSVLLLLGSQLAENEVPRYPDLDTSRDLGTPNLAAEAAAAFDPAGGQHAESQAPTNQPPGTQPPVGTPPASNPLRDSSTQPADAAGGLTRVVKPAKLLTQLTSSLQGETLQGSPLSLAEAIQSARTRVDQTRRVEHYWDLSQAVASYRLAAREFLELQTQRNGLAQPDPSWTQAILAAQNRLTVSEGSVRTAQYRLQHELGRVGESTLPLPSDAPHCGSYETKYDQIFTGRSSREAQELSELLPLRHELLSQLATQVEAARQWHSRVSQQRTAAGGGMQQLKAYEQYALQREAFVDAAFQYNDEIVRYTELAVPQQIGTVRLVSMLIQTDAARAADWQEGAIQRASAEEAIESQPAGSQPPSTYEDPTRSRAFRVTPNHPAGEHSVLVKTKEGESPPDDSSSDKSAPDKSEPE